MSETTLQNQRSLSLLSFFYDMTEKIDEREQAQEKKAIPREPTEVSGAKESKGTE